MMPSATCPEDHKQHRMCMLTHQKPMKKTEKKNTKNKSKTTQQFQHTQNSDAQTKSRRNTWSGMKKSSGITCLMNARSTHPVPHEISAKHVCSCCSKNSPSTYQIVPKEAKALLLQGQCICPVSLVQPKLRSCIDGRLICLSRS